MSCLISLLFVLKSGFLAEPKLTDFDVLYMAAQPTDKEARDAADKAAAEEKAKQEATDKDAADEKVKKNTVVKELMDIENKQGERQKNDKKLKGNSDNSPGDSKDKIK